jgi:hypothetical protein
VEHEDFPKSAAAWLLVHKPCFPLSENQDNVHLPLATGPLPYFWIMDLVFTLEFSKYHGEDPGKPRDEETEAKRQAIHP